MYADGSVSDSTDRNEYTLVLQAGAWKISADVQPNTQVITPGVGTPPSVTQPGTPASVTSSSSNWSGYAASGGTFTLGVLVPLALALWAVRDITRGPLRSMPWSTALWYAHGLFRDYNIHGRD